ncbi:YhcN/YlaJ family sporulation lipoprotein [Paenibacillus rhizoplanae]
MRDDDFGSMEVSKELADRVAAMPEVRSANVIMVGRSAYVAVMLENTSGGVHTRNITGREATGRGTAAGVPGMTGTGGSMAGIPGSMTGTGTVGGTGMAAPEDYPGNGNNGIMSRSSMGGMIKTRFPGRSSIKSPQRLKRQHIRQQCVCLGEPGFRGTGRLLCPGIPCRTSAQRLRE